MKRHEETERDKNGIKRHLKTERGMKRHKETKKVMKGHEEI